MKVGPANFAEQALTFDCEGETLVGVVSIPEQPAATAVVIVVGGPQYRAGSHRQFVHLARSLAAAGHAVLRFDYRGMGDSSGDAHDFESATPDIAAALSALQTAVPAAERVVLLGLCDGASAALIYCDRTSDPRVAGLVLLNPWVRSEASLARTHVRHYYGRRVMERGFWLKLLRGGVDVGSVLRTFRRAGASSPAREEVATFQQRMLRGWKQADRDVLLLLSGDDYTAKEFVDTTAADAAWSAALNRPRVVRHDLEGADHTFSNAAERQRVERLTVAWMTATSGQSA